MTKRFIHRSSEDVGLIFTAYNLRRLISILGISALKKHLKGCASLFLRKITHEKEINFHWTNSIILSQSPILILCLAQITRGGVKNERFWG